MDVEPVGPSGAPSASEKKGRKSTPDSEEFREMMKTGKVGESEFEKPQKRKFQQQEEAPQLPQPPVKTSPTGPTPFAAPPKITTPKGGEEVQPPEELQVTPTEDTEQEVEDEKKAKEKKKKEFEEVTISKKEGMKIEQPPTEKKGKIEKLPTPREKIFIKEVPTPTKEVAQKKVTQKPAFPKEEKGKISTTKEKKPSEEKKEREEFKYEISSVLQEMPPNIAAQTGALTSPLTPYLHPDIIPLFEKMVGTIIQIQAQGITTTQVILNSPAFTSSIFFGSSIILEKYSTAPDSFNIFLRGPQQAVVMFNENLDGLLDAFKRGNFNFKIGRLEAEHERPLFKRKEKTSGKDTDTGSTK